MKIVHIEDFFHPEAGYQINILPKYSTRMGHEVTIITSLMDKVPEGLTSFFGREGIGEKDRAYEEKYGVKIIRLPLLAFVSGRAVFTEELFRAIQAEQPDVVYVHGNDTLTGMRYLLKRKQLGYPLVMDSHMLEMASQNRLSKLFRWGYRRVFTPMLIKNSIPVIRTQDDPYVEKCLGIPLTQAPWISVGSDTMLFLPDAEAKKAFRAAHQIPEDAFVVVYAGKLDASKGGMLLAQAIEKKLETAKEVVFVIVGATSGEYGRQVEETFARSEHRVLRFPTQKYADLPPFYQAADLAVFPRQCSLSFYDAQACGLPVLSEDNNINIERNSHENGWTFRAEDVDDFRKKMAVAADLPEEMKKQIAENACHFVTENYNYANIAKEYEKVILSRMK